MGEPADTPSRLPEYADLLTAPEAAAFLEALMGSFAPTLETFLTIVKPQYARKHPGSPEARLLRPAARGPGFSKKNAWRRGQLVAYAKARAKGAGPQQSEEPAA